MILTDYYKFERLATKARLRMDCTASTASYEELECRRATKANRATEKRDATNVGDLVVYYGDVPPPTIWRRCTQEGRQKHFH